MTVKAIDQISKTDGRVFRNIFAHLANVGRVDFGKALDALVERMQQVNSSWQVYRIGEVGGQVVYGSLRNRIGIVLIDNTIKIVQMLERGYKVLGEIK